MTTILTGMYLIYHLAFGHYGVLFDGYRQGYWWQYLISIVVILLGGVFLWGGETESLIVDKQTGFVSK